MTQPTLEENQSAAPEPNIERVSLLLGVVFMIVLLLVIVMVAATYIDGQNASTTTFNLQNSRDAINLLATHAAVGGG